MTELFEDVNGSLTLTNCLHRQLEQKLTQGIFDELLVICLLGVDVRVQAPDKLNDLSYLRVKLVCLKRDATHAQTHRIFIVINFQVFIITLVVIPANIDQLWCVALVACLFTSLHSFLF